MNLRDDCRASRGYRFDLIAEVGEESSPRSDYGRLMALDEFLLGGCETGGKRSRFCARERSED